ncbi:hypothetical protein OE88DRAFT_1111513 [Heliocybe sulcata]|uniref:Uncharacterized protein n=1 Tax=Heliocybe sulcata TaxID=5364 RepID=A0A5C3MLV3_9AGAM|nr:hypothetical protein OE88DRAFT_1111513 [Heliocybe sulcata]
MIYVRARNPGYARSFLTFCVMASMRHVSRNESRLLEPFTQELVLFSLDCASRDPVFNTVARGHSWFIRKLYSNYDWVSHSDEVWDILWIPLLKQLAYPTSGTMTPVLVARFLNWANTMLGLLCPIDLSAEVQDELRRLWQVITRGEFVLAGENLASRTIAILPRVFAPLPQQERYVLCEETPKSLNHDLNYGHHDIGHYPDVDALDNIINSDYYIHVRTAHGTKVLDKPFLYLMTCPVPRGARDMVVRVECRRTHAFAVQSQLLPTQICYASIIRDSGESHGCWPILPYVLPLWQTLAVTVEEEHDLMKSLQPGDRIAIWIMPHTYVRTADVHLFTANSS